MFISLVFVCFFFCKQKTAYEMRISDWSSDVCSSDLCPAFERHRALRRKRPMSDTSISYVTTLCGLNRAGLAIARLGVVLVSGAVRGACNPAPTKTTAPAHEKHLPAKLMSQSIMHCTDGPRAAADVMQGGVKRERQARRR